MVFTRPEFSSKLSRSQPFDEFFRVTQKFSEIATSLGSFFQLFFFRLNFGKRNIRDKSPLPSAKFVLFYCVVQE